LNNGRFGMAAALAGTQKRLISQAVDFAANRIQFGKKIKDFGVIQEKLARMAVLQYVTETMAYMVSGNMDRGSKEFQLEAAISKIFASEAAWTVADDTIQILGGMGYMKETGTEKVMRDLRIFRIFEGTNDILRLFVALTGIQATGKRLLSLQKQITKNPLGNIGAILTEGGKRARRVAGVSIGPDITQYVHEDLKFHAELCSKSIGKFGAVCEDLVVKHKKNIIHEQMVCYELGNCAIDIYGMICTLSRASRSLTNNTENCEHEKMLTQLYCSEASQRVSKTAKALTDNKNIQNNQLKAQIAEDIVNQMGPVPSHPLGF